MMKRKTAALALAAVVLPLAFTNTSNATAPTFSTEYKMVGGGGTEPGIDITRDSNGKQVVYVHGTFGLPLHNKLWRLDEGAAAFKSVTFSTPYNRLPGGGDADIAIKGDEVWFIDLWAGSNSIQYSADKGETWTRGTPLSSLPPSDRQWIALGDTAPNALTGDPETTVYLTDQGIGVPRGTTFARSRNNGLAWDYYAPVRESGVGTGMSGIPAHIVSQGKRVAILTNVGGTYTVAVSADEGATWKLNKVSGNLKDGNGSLVGLTMNPTNSMQMAVSYPAAGNANGTLKNQIVVRTTNDGGTTWSDPTPISPGLDANGNHRIGWFPWIDWHGDKIAAAWYQARNSGFTDPNTPTAGNKWDIYYSESTDNGANWTAATDVGIGSVKNGAICTNGLACDADRDLGDFLQLAVDDIGKSWITFVNAGGAAGLLGNGIYVVKQD